MMAVFDDEERAMSGEFWIPDTPPTGADRGALERWCVEEVKKAVRSFVYSLDVYLTNPTDCAWHDQPGIPITIHAGTGSEGGDWDMNLRPHNDTILKVINES